MGYWTVGNELYGAVVRSKLLVGDLVRWVIKKGTVNAGNGFNIRCNGSQVVRYHHNSHSIIQLAKHLVQLPFKAAIHVCVWLIKNKHLRLGY